MDLEDFLSAVALNWSLAGWILEGNLRDFRAI